MENRKQNFKTEKKRKQNKRGKEERQKGEKHGKKMDLSIWMFFAFICFCFFACKKKQIEKAKSFFSPLV